MLVLTQQQMLAVRVSPYPDRLIRPRLRTDGKFAVSEAVLTEDAHLHARETLLAGEIEAVAQSFASVGSRETIVINGKQAQILADDNAWCLQTSGSGHRFELRKGDVGLAQDSLTQSRCELVGNANLFSVGLDIWQAWSNRIDIDTGFRRITSGNWSIVNQWHSTPEDGGTNFNRSPVVAFDYGNNAFVISTRSSAAMANNNGIGQRHYTADLPVGWQHFVLRLRLGPNGTIQVWRNGSEIVNAAVPIGYYADTTGPLAYPQWGIYRLSGPDPLAVTTSNMEWGTIDLSDRIANPLPV